jgi:hypothetical protein
VAIDVESKALVDTENEKNVTIVEVRNPGYKNEAKLHRGSALKQVRQECTNKNITFTDVSWYKIKYWMLFTTE